ncbi:flagellar hook-length control protein [Psychromonas ingrahamii 37]|uniref:Flagellar hook-length control protein n=1 Tax=Psychromonas ingrahamii (strain DSM 17664 / CCUG 51855 / 37) TaxID=357804 RepID=A1T0K1_PSYIN|nr:flagellar hook-length control protein FliK [Psychromonas ingrahamii]ABM05266.1 flagellar hook-length control protein [Psychromonas ingrahamii 37]
MDLTLRLAAPVNTAASGTKSESKPLLSAFTLLDGAQESSLAEGFSEIVATSADGDQIEFTVQESLTRLLNLAKQVKMTQTASSADLMQTDNRSAANFSAPIDMIAQVEGFTRINQRTALPTSSLFRNGSVDSAHIRDAIHLSHANSLPLKNIISSSIASLDSAQQNISALPGINASSPGLTEKIIEWAKVDLHAELERSDSKAAASSRIGEKLLLILQDRINIQASNNIKSAQIRLDPPDLGHIKLTVVIEGDKVSVAITSPNSVVREALMQTSERLRHELLNQNFINVSVDISSGSEGRANKEQNSQEQILGNQFASVDDKTTNSQDEFIVKV